MKRLLFLCLWILSSTLLMPMSNADEVPAKEIADSTLETLAKELEKEFVAKNLPGVLACFDEQLWLDRVLDAVELPEAVRRTVGSQLAAGKFFESHWTEEIKKTDSQTSFRFLKVVARNDEKRALFRSVDSDGLTYLEMVPRLKSDGSLRFEDIYDTRGGESSTLTFQSMLQAFQKSDSDLMQYNSTIQQIEAIAGKTDWNGALKLLSELAPKYQSTKTVILRKIRFRTYNKNFAKCVLLAKEYQKQFGNDESIDVVMVEPLLAYAQFEELSEVLTRLEKFTGPEPYLMAIQAICASQGMGDNDELKRLCAKAMELEPTLSYAADPAIQVSMKESNFAETTRLIIHQLKNGNSAYVDKLLAPLSATPYLNSDAYRELLKWKNEQRPAAEKIQVANKEQEAKLLQDKDIQESIRRLRSAVKAENYASGTKLLLHLEEKHNIKFADVFFAQEEMKGYAKSPEYQLYLEKRPQARP